MDQAFDQSFVRSFSRRQQGLGVAPPPQAAAPQSTPRPLVLSRPQAAPKGVGRAPTGLGWNTTIQGPMPAGLQNTYPPPGAPTWWNYAWIYIAPPGSPPPTQPPPGVTSSGAVIGTWVETKPTHWVWYAPDNTLTQMNGVWVVDNSMAPPSWSSFAAPSGSPDGTQGSWSEVHEGYWVWIPVGGTVAPSSVASTTMDPVTAALLTVFGLAVVGGIGYLIFD
jgi:hypothetical protein